MLDVFEYLQSLMCLYRFCSLSVQSLYRDSRIEPLLRMRRYYPPPKKIVSLQITATVFNVKIIINEFFFFFNSILQ